MSKTYSGTEYNALKRGPDGRYERALIKLTNKCGIHRGCDFNLKVVNGVAIPKRVDDGMLWNPDECSSGGIHAVLGEENVLEWLYYCEKIGKMERAFLVQVPDGEDVKVVEHRTKIKMSSMIICEELNFDEVIRAARELKRKLQELEQAERMRIQELEEARKRAEKKRREKAPRGTREETASFNL